MFRGRPRLARVLAILALTTILVALAAEGTLRFLRFSDVARSWRIAKELRHPSRYADWRSQEEWFVLQYLWLPPEQRGRMPPLMPHHDSRLGWTSERFLPGDYEHVWEDTLGDRRPILLFGDSFSACVTGPDTCFEALLEQGGLAEEHALINYGVPGYGLDQVYLLSRAVLDRYLDRQPIVVVGLLVDNDLDRCTLEFRNLPKPRLRLVDGQLIFPAGEIPTGQTMSPTIRISPGATWWSCCARRPECGSWGTVRSSLPRSRR